MAAVRRDGLMAGWPRRLGIAVVSVLLVATVAAAAGLPVGATTAIAYPLGQVTAAVLFATRGARRRTELLPWSIGALVTGTFAFTGPRPEPLPADAPPGLVVIVYLLAYAVILLLARRRAQAAFMDLWLEGIVGTLAIAAVGALGLALAVGDGGGAVPAVAIVGDLLLAGAVATQCLLTAGRIGRDWLLLGAGLVLVAAADVVVLAGGPSGGPRSLSTLLFIAAIGAQLAAGWQQFPGHRGAALAPHSTVSVTTWSSVASLAVLGSAAIIGVDKHVVVLALTALLAATARGWWVAARLRRLDAAHTRALARLRRDADLRDRIAELGAAALDEGGAGPTVPDLAVQALLRELAISGAAVAECSPGEQHLVVLAAAGAVEAGEIAGGCAGLDPAHVVDAFGGGPSSFVVAWAVPGIGGPRAALVLAADAPIELDADELTFVSTTVNVLAAWLRRQDAQAALLRTHRMESVGNLAGAVAHDVNNLLGVIGASADEIRAQLPVGSPAAQDLDALDEAARRAARLSARLLGFSRGDRLPAGVVHLDACVRACEPLLTRALGRGAELRLRLGAAGAYVRLEASQVEQVLMNLCINARDASGDVPVVTVTTRTTGEGVTLSVSDGGAGMSDDVRARAFDPFFTTKGPAGTGIGLATVYGIVQRAGGTVDLQSRPGSGTTVGLRLPLAAPEPQETPAASPPAIAPTTAPLRIVLADDEAALRNVLARVLRRLGAEVVEAPDGRAALELLAGRRVDALVTDVMMPGMSGVELARIVRAEHPALPIVFTSGYLGEHPELLDLGPVLVKPVRADALLEVVRHVVGTVIAPAA